VMYSPFEGLRYYITSAFRGTRWPQTPQGASYFFSRRRYARTAAVCVLAVQLLVLAVAWVKIMPGFMESVAQTTFQAPTALKLAIEIAVYGIEIALKAAGSLALLLIPTWAGLIFLMAKRSREEYYVDITPEGVSVGSPVDRFFVKKEEITGIKLSPFFPMMASIRIASGGRKIVIRKLIPSAGVPQKKPLVAWLCTKAPSRTEIREGMLSLKQSLDALIAGK